MCTAPPIDNPREISVSRHIDAPPAKVWEAMTNRITEWWCPKPWTTEIVEQDWRSGGRSAMVMHGPDGETSPGDGIFLEVTPGKRFVFTDAVTSDWMPQGPFMIGGFEIEAEGGGTRYRAWARHWTDEALAQHQEMGFEPGWGAVADQLKALCEAE